MPKMQDAFFGGCLHGTIPVNEGLVCRCPDTPEMQEHFPAGAQNGTIPTSEVGAPVCRKCRSSFRPAIASGQQLRFYVFAAQHNACYDP
jgi:hypothetical protein